MEEKESEQKKEVFGQVNDAKEEKSLNHNNLIKGVQLAVGSIRFEFFFFFPLREPRHLAHEDSSRRSSRHLMA